MYMVCPNMYQANTCTLLKPRRLRKVVFVSIIFYCDVLHPNFFNNFLRSICTMIFFKIINHQYVISLKSDCCVCIRFCASLKCK